MSEALKFISVDYPADSCIGVHPYLERTNIFYCKFDAKPEAEAKKPEQSRSILLLIFVNK